MTLLFAGPLRARCTWSSTASICSAVAYPRCPSLTSPAVCRTRTLRVEDGNLSVVTIITLILIAILGLIWFIAELRPSTPRRVRMGKGTYVTRGVVGEEISTVAEQVPDSRFFGQREGQAKAGGQSRPRSQG